MALISGAKILIFDEPTAGLDPHSRRSIWPILRELRNEGKTIVITTHHLDEADELADRIGVLTQGKIHKKILFNCIIIRKIICCRFSRLH